ncbi:isoprenylcysteine carboxyl methyltransferase family protein [Faunimonas sp. B44]|uniref:isoprenylcysteine carboxyl methyltransferase family protein n=1 Tax=Faunimonas sp. B44 TaxID=3461493 RepID=UPI0040448078
MLADWLTFAILALLTAQRLGELVYARANTRRLLRAGGQEHCAGQYPLIVALHAAWLAGLWMLVWDRPILPGFLAALAALQVLRLWVLLTLGRRWTTRVIVVPGEKLVRAGPYRILRHPNYAIVAAEIACGPLVFGLLGYAITFSVANAAVLWMRIRCEEAALASIAAERPCAPGT